MAAKERLMREQGDQCKSQFWIDKYENRPGLYWHEFYKRNRDHFYKDRHYLHIVFPELAGTSDTPVISVLQGLTPSNIVTRTQYLLEIGSGVGNAVLPLLDINPSLFIHAIDVAPSAIDILRYLP